MGHPAQFLHSKTIIENFVDVNSLTENLRVYFLRKILGSFRVLIIIKKVCTSSRFPAFGFRNTQTISKFVNS